MLALQLRRSKRWTGYAANRFPTSSSARYTSSTSFRLPADPAGGRWLAWDRCRRNTATSKLRSSEDEARAQVDAWLTTWLPHSKIRVAFDHSYSGRGLQKILGSPVGPSTASDPSFSVSKPYAGSPSGLAHGQQWTGRGLDGGIVSACQRIKAFVLITAASFRLFVLSLMWIKEQFAAS